MAKWIEYLLKKKPADEDMLMLEDAETHNNKRVSFSGIADWLIEKMKKNNLISGALRFKGSSAYAALPGKGAAENDYYYCTDGDGTHGPGYYAWNGSSWIWIGNNDKGIDKSLKVEGAAAEAAATGEAIASLKGDIEYFQDDVTKAFNATENLYNPHSFTNEKGIALTIADGTEYADSTTVNAITTGYFDTHEGDVWRFYRWNTAKDNIFGMEIRVHWFNENEKYISGAIITGEATAPTNARHLRFTEKFTLLYPSLDVMVRNILAKRKSIRTTSKKWYAS